jgi:hypothetical protein
MKQRSCVHHRMESTLRLEAMALGVIGVRKFGSFH